MKILTSSSFFNFSTVWTNDMFRMQSHDINQHHSLMQNLWCRSISCFSRRRNSFGLRCGFISVITILSSLSFLISALPNLSILSSPTRISNLVTQLISGPLSQVFEAPVLEMFVTYLFLHLDTLSAYISFDISNL